VKTVSQVTVLLSF